MRPWYARGQALAITVAVLASGSLSACDGWVEQREPPYRLVHSWGGQGDAPGQFDDPNGIAVRAGRVYVADSRNHRIQVFTSGGDFLAQWPVPEQGRPMNLDADGAHLYAADYWNDVIRVYALADGTLVRSLGGPGSGPGQLRNPGGVATGARGRLFVADTFNQRVQQLTAGGEFVRQWGITGETGYLRAGRFNYPIDVAVAADGTLYVADGFNDRVQVFAPDGSFRHKWGGPFAINLKGSGFGWFAVPTGIALGADGSVFVADQENNRIQKFTADGQFRTAFGTAHDGPGYTESAVAVAADGTVYTVNLIDHRVEVWRPPQRDSQ